MRLSEATTAWLFLVVAGVLEACWAVGLKYTKGFSEVRSSVVVIVAIALSILLLSLSMRSLPASTAYPVWTGIGILGTAGLGVVILGERLTTARALLLLLLLVSIVGLRMTKEPARRPECRASTM